MVNRINSVFFGNISSGLCHQRKRLSIQKCLPTNVKTTPELESINTLIIENLMLKQQGAQIIKKKKK